MKKKYFQPVIKRIKLDPEQAVLVVCMLNGAYWNTTGATAEDGCQVPGTAIGNWCKLTPKGGATAVSVTIGGEDLAMAS